MPSLFDGTWPTIVSCLRFEIFLLWFGDIITEEFPFFGNY